MTNDNNIKRFEEMIVTGDRFLCKKNVIMNGLSAGKVAYVKGREYISEQDGCITDEQGTKAHWWSDSNTCKVGPDFKKYFNPLTWNAAYSLDRVVPDGRTALQMLADAYDLPAHLLPNLTKTRGVLAMENYATHQVQLATKPLEDKIKALEERQRWIPVSERLPEEGDEYNVVLDLQDGLGDPVSSTLEFDAIKKEWFYPGTDIYSDKVTHWQPLPFTPDRK